MAPDTSRVTTSSDVFVDSTEKESLKRPHWLLSNSDSNEHTSTISFEKELKTLTKKQKPRRSKPDGFPKKRKIIRDKFAKLMENYEKSLESGIICDIKEAYMQLPFKQLTIPRNKISAYRLQSLLVGDNNGINSKNVMMYVEDSEIFDSKVFFDLLIQLDNTIDEDEKKNILKKMSLKPLIDYIGILRFHGYEYPNENKCLTCHSIFEDRHLCMHHMFSEHSQEENLANIKILLNELEVPDENEDSSDSPDNQLQNELDNQNDEDNDNETTSEPSVDEFQSASSQRGSRRLRTVRIISNVEQNVTLNETASTSSMSLRLDSPEPEASSKKEDSAALDKLTIVVTHTDYPKVKINSKQWNMFQKVVLREVDKSKDFLPKFRSTNFQEKVGVIVIIAANQLSKEWFCRRLSLFGDSMGNMPLKTEKIVTYRAKIPLYNEPTSLEKILDILQKYNPTLSTKEWIIVNCYKEAQMDELYLTVQLMKSSVIALKALHDKIYYKLGQIIFSTEL